MEFSASTPTPARFNRFYAVGDIHGQIALLDAMAASIAEDLAHDPPAAALTVFVGDYIDHGPGSAAVIDRLANGRFPTPIVTLRGNHEQLLLDSLENGRLFAAWLKKGGDATLRSYLGTWPPPGGTDVLARDTLMAVLPAAHSAFLRQTRLSFRVPGYFFCHAGIRPGVPLDAQAPKDLMTIRRPFHTSTYDFGAVVVHGHTPVIAPESLPNRINIDTGAFKTGTLTAVVLDGPRRRFLSVHER